MRLADSTPLALWLTLATATLQAEVSAPDPLAAMAAAIGPLEARQAFAGISAFAEGNGPRGVFTSAMLSLADGSARFRQVRAGETSELLLLEGTPYERSGAGDTAALPLHPADAALASFVRGHEVHRMLLDLERRFRPDSRAAPPGCLALRGPDDLAVTLCRAADGDLAATLELELPAAAGGGSVTLELADWRPLLGVRLPFAVDFLHAGERHSYRYTAVLPFGLAPGVALPAPPAARLARLDDLAALATAHARVLEAHRRSDVALLLADADERSISSGRGVLRETRREELAARLGPYFATTRFTRYDDVVPPVLAVSADGTMGWLACQIEAAGTQSQASGPPQPVAFGYSWVELYARQSGEWRAIGNASSALPGNS